MIAMIFSYRPAKSWTAALLMAEHSSVRADEQVPLSAGSLATADFAFGKATRSQAHQEGCTRTFDQCCTSRDLEADCGFRKGKVSRTRTSESTPCRWRAHVPEEKMLRRSEPSCHALQIVVLTKLPHHGLGHLKRGPFPRSNPDL